MVNGVIISSFGLLREETENKITDNKNKCFLCSVDRKSFQKAKVDFKSHIKNNHNIKDYIEFLLNIMEKETADLEDDEITIKEKITEGSVSIFPLGVFTGPSGIIKSNE
jgi:hypothetical protein